MIETQQMENGLCKGDGTMVDVAKLVHKFYSIPSER